MANIFLTNENYNATNSSAKFFGSAATEKVTINSTATNLQFDASIDKVVFSKSYSSYQFQQSGTNLNIYEGNTLISTLNVNSDISKQIAFLGTDYYNITFSGTQMKINDINVPSTKSSMTLSSGSLSSLSIGLASDTGDSNTDGITNDSTINVTTSSNAVSWEYSTDYGSTWTTGTGSSFELDDGFINSSSSKNGNKLQVREQYSSGTYSNTVSSNNITIDKTLDSDNSSDSYGAILYSFDYFQNTLTPEIKENFDATLSSYTITINDNSDTDFVATRTNVNSSYIDNFDTSTYRDDSGKVINLSEGTYTVNIQALDIAGNTYNHNYSLVIDTTAPVLTYNVSEDGTQVSFSTNENVTLSDSKYGGSSTSYELNANTNSTLTIDPNLYVSPHDYYIRATDLSGNYSFLYIIAGTNGADNISGNDITLGFDGDDRISAGNNYIDGGNGADTIVFTSLFTSTTITNFKSGVDQVEIGNDLKTLVDDITTSGITWAQANGSAGEEAVNITSTVEALFVSQTENSANSSTAVIASDLTNTTKVAAAFEAAFNVTAASTDDTLLVLESSNTQGTFGIYVYIENGTTINQIDTDEITILATVTADSVATADFILV